MPRVAAAFLTGVAIFAIGASVSAIRHDIEAATAGVKPVHSAPEPSLSAVPTVACRPDERAAPSPSPAPAIAPLLPAPEFAPSPTIAPAPPPQAIAAAPTPTAAPPARSADIASPLVPKIAPPALASRLGAKPTPAESRRGSEMSPAPALPLRPPRVFAAASPKRKPATAPKRLVAVEAAAGRPPAVRSFPFAATAHTRVWDCRAIRSLLRCAPVRANYPFATAEGLNNLRRFQ